MIIRIAVLGLLLACFPSSSNAQAATKTFSAADLAFKVKGFRKEILGDTVPLDLCKVALFWTQRGTPVDSGVPPFARFTRREDCRPPLQGEALFASVDSVGLFRDSVVVHGRKQAFDSSHLFSYLYDWNAIGRMRFVEYRVCCIISVTPIQKPTFGVRR